MPGGPWIVKSHRDAWRVGVLTFPLEPRRAYPRNWKKENGG